MTNSARPCGPPYFTACFAIMPDAAVISQGTICRDTYLYSSHPHASIAMDGDIVVVLNQTRRNRFIFHPPHDPEYRNVVTRSRDQGETWSRPQVAPGYGYSGTECAGLTTLGSGRMLLNQWRNRWYPLAVGERSAPEPVQLPDEFVRELVESDELDTGGQIAGAPADFAPWARGHGDSFVHVSEDGGRSFIATARIDTGLFHGGYGLRGCVERPDGSLLLPLNDIPEFCTIYTVVSCDGGLSWRNPSLLARQNGHLFTEPAMILTARSNLLCLMRDDATGIMHACRSLDGGGSWSMAEPTGIEGYPPHLLLLSDGRIFCTYGMRQPEFSIRAVVSEDDGRSWRTDSPIMIRRRLPNRDLGYPATVLLGDASLFTVYYCQDDKGVTGVEFTRWRI
ncbi:MAG: exo-alpha-sialidase [Dongiaceae bacterium]